jgi:energy-coupling factor transport system ATP-binding protein
MNTIVTLKDVSYQYPVGKHPVLKNVNLELQQGYLYAVIGSNGSGKTTLCNVIRGFIPHFHKGKLEGEVMVYGKNIIEYEMGELAVKVGFVFQNPFIQVSGVKDTVFEEIAFGLENLGVPVDEIRERVEDILQLLKINHLRDKHPQELSGGQRQRVALASIIVMEPDLLVIDEPTSQLDPQGTEDVFEIIGIMKNKGKTILLVEHKIELIAEYADYVIFLHDGEIITKGPTKEVLSDKKLFDFQMALPQYAMLGIEMNAQGLPLNQIPITENETYHALRDWLSREGVE